MNHITTLIAIDPGPEQSAFVVLRCGDDCGMPAVEAHQICGNDDLLYFLRNREFECLERVVIEKIASYGMAVGASTFETCVWTGRFIEAADPVPVDRLTRVEIKTQICRSAKAKDANVRQALIDRYGGELAIKKGGPLYKVSSHVWASLACGIAWWETRAVRMAVPA